MTMMQLIEGSPIKFKFEDLAAGESSKAIQCNGAITRALICVEDATTIAMTVEGCVNDTDAQGNPIDDADCNWFTLGLTSVEDFSNTTSIEADGAFYVELSGFSRVRVSATTLTGEPIITLVKVN